MSTPPNDRGRVTDAIARDLLARAAHIDQDSTQLAHLRAAAVEAGISEAAFDEALREWRADSTRARMTTSWHQRILPNLGGFVVGWGALAVLAAADRLLDAAPLVHKMTDPLGLLVGALVAARLRARTATIIMGGLAVSQGAEFLMDLLAHGSAIQGFYAHVGLMVAGIGGVAAS
ncbi:MAG TPA: hypothetical protein VHB25_20540, partial [Gemmatimonadaceae bacterium]|nr:hypothetical protein [Gemmatimonadaceae bacterium]